MNAWLSMAACDLFTWPQHSIYIKWGRQEAEFQEENGPQVTSTSTSGLYITTIFFTKIIHVPSFHLHTTTSTYIYMISCVKFSSIPVPRFYDWYTYGWKYYGARGCMRLVVVHKVDWNAPYFFFFLMYRRSSNARIISLHARSISIIVAIMVREIPLFSWDTGWRMHTQLIVYIHACPRAYMRTYMYTSIRTYQS